jgi:uncharacterized membrane protein
MKKSIALIALIGSLIIGAQVIVILFSGEAVCLNQGCKMVESLTTISPLLFNLAGFTFFQLLFWVSWLGRSRSEDAMDWLGIMLLAGLSVEGVLLSYLMFVAHVFCSYCLIIFLMIFLMNVLSGRKQLITGVAVLVAINAIFSMLSFGPSLVLSRYQSLNAGTFAVRTCSAPVKELYLMFSADCPHCQNVIKALENCNSCDFHFNPVERVDSLDLADLEYKASYSPAINRLILKLLGINEIPVVIAKNPDGFSFIKGEKNIIKYIEEGCFQADPLLYIDRSSYSDQEELKFFDQEEGVCTVDPDCDPPG